MANCDREGDLQKLRYFRIRKRTVSYTGSVFLMHQLFNCIIYYRTKSGIHASVFVEAHNSVEETKWMIEMLKDRKSVAGDSAIPEALGSSIYDVVYFRYRRLCSHGESNIIGKRASRVH